MLRDLPPPDLSATPIRFSEEGADADDTHAPAVCLALFSSHRWKKVRIRDRFCILNSICSKPSMGNDSKSVNYNNSERALPCIPMRVLRSWESMTLRIKRVQARIRQSGEFRSERLDQVETEIALCELPAVLDLEESDLVDVEAVRFFNACEAEGISVLHCSPYISKWMLRERTQPDVPKSGREERTDPRKRLKLLPR